jgi:hypothetical protein
MNESSFERRARVWLEAGPTTLPDHAIDLLRESIAEVPQQRSLRSRLPRIGDAPGRWLASAAAVVLLVGGSVAVLPTLLSDIAGPRPVDHPLYAFPDATLIFERSGGPSAADEDVALGHLPGGGVRVYVVAGACTGSPAITVQAYDPSAQPGTPEDGGPIAPEPYAGFQVPCDGAVHHRNFDAPDDGLDLIATVPDGTTWRIAAGRYRDVGDEPDFPTPALSEGRYLLMDGPAMLTTTEPGPGIGIQVPDGAAEIGVVVQCVGDPITISNTLDQDTTRIECIDPSAETRLVFPAEGRGFDVQAGTTGVSWVRLVAEADGEITTARPTAPPLPDDLAAVGFGEGDGEYVAFGRLDQATQDVIRLPGALVGLGFGDIVSVASETEDGTGMRLEAWSTAAAAPVRALAETGGRIYRSWMDPTHQLVYYGAVMPDLSAEWRRVRMDGSGDEAIITMPTLVMPTSLAEALAIDDSVFVVEWCPTVGPCVRHIHDGATGATREVDLAGDRTCELIGVVAGQVIATTAPACDGPDPRSVTVQDLDGGPRRALPIPAGSAVLVMTEAGPVVLVAEDLVDHTVYRTVDLAGGEPREVARIDHPEGFTPYPSLVRLPTDWVLLGGPLADTPQNRSVGRALPRALNVITGELLELPNLPHSTE